jgi:hypothetical protein
MKETSPEVSNTSQKLMQTVLMFYQMAILVFENLFIETL